MRELRNVRRIETGDRHSVGFGDFDRGQARMGFTAAELRATSGFVDRLIPMLVLMAAIGCGDADDGNSTTGTAAAGGTGGTAGTAGTGGTGFSSDPPLVIGGDERPALVDIPESYDPSNAYPLLIVLHGFGPYNGEVEAGILGLNRVVDTKGFVLVMPDGTLNERGDRYWNGTPACCDPSDSIDDVGYLTGLIEEAKQTYRIDENRVYLVGHSNGGFMSFRMACEASEFITAIVSLAGSTFDDPADCQPATRPVSVLAVHGTADATIPYAGRAGFYPGAVETVEYFATAAGCDSGAPTIVGNLDLVAAVDGEETEQVEYTTGCDAGVDAALWTIEGGAHIPYFYFPGSGQPAFADFVVDWLLEHSR